MTQDQSKATPGSQESPGAGAGEGAEGGGGDDSASDKATFLSTLAEGKKKIEQAKAKAAVAEASVAVDEDPAKAQAGGDDPDKADPASKEEATEDDEETSEKSEDKDKDKDEPILDKATQKRLAAIQKAEKAQKQAIAAERAKFLEEKAEWEEQSRELKKKVSNFEKAVQEGKTNPLMVMEALGFSEESFEDLSRLFYAHSAKGKNDPRVRDLVEAGMKDRGYRDELSALRDEVRKLKQESTLKEQQAKATQAANAEIEKIVSFAQKSGDAPLLAQLMAKNPAKARFQIMSITKQLLDANDEWPDAEDVVAVFEKTRKAELEDLGIDLSAILKPKVQPKQKDKPAAEKKPAPTLSNDQGTSTSQVRPELDEDEERAKIVSELRKIRNQGVA